MLSVFQNAVLRKIFVTRACDVAEEWRILIRRWVVHMAHVEVRSVANSDWVGKPRGKRPIGNTRGEGWA